MQEARGDGYLAAYHEDPDRYEDEANLAAERLASCVLLRRVAQT